MSKKYRNFTFTIPNYCENNVKFLENLFTAGRVKYLVYGKEVGKENGLPHLQGFIMFKSQRSFKQVKQLFTPYHIEVCKGTPTQNFEYCTKDGDFTEYGTRPKGQGKRTDIDTVKDLVIEGADIRKIYMVATSYQALRFAEKGIELFGMKRNWKTKVSWYYGPTGTGKTHTAYIEDFKGNCWMSGKTLRWWQGYEGEENVIFDDFRKDFCTFHELLRILDRYPYSVEVKGSSRQLLARHIIITCPYHPRCLYSTREDVGQLLRRIECIKYFGSEDLDQKSGVILDPDVKTLL